MHKTHNTLSTNVRAQSSELLNLHLAAAIDLHGQVKQAHWNVRGPGFLSVHELFDTVATGALDWSDLLAERVAALGDTAMGTVQTATAQSFLVPYPLRIAPVAEHIFAVSAALAAFDQSIVTAIGRTAEWGDAVTADLLTEIARSAEKLLWFVEAHSPPKN